MFCIYNIYIFLNQEFREFSNKIYNPYNKAPQKYLEFFDKFD